MATRPDIHHNTDLAKGPVCGTVSPNDDRGNFSLTLFLHSVTFVETFSAFPVPLKNRRLYKHLDDIKSLTWKRIVKEYKEKRKTMMQLIITEDQNVENIALVMSFAQYAPGPEKLFSSYLFWHSVSACSSSESSP